MPAVGSGRLVDLGHDGARQAVGGHELGSLAMQGSFHRKRSGGIELQMERNEMGWGTGRLAPRGKRCPGCAGATLGVLLEVKNADQPATWPAGYGRTNEAGPDKPDG
jgi:hypothetical protein